MRAWRVDEPGEPELVMRLADVKVPEPTTGVVRLRVTAAALNFSDVLLCRGHYQVKPSLPFTPGVEVCGVVDELGPDVDGLARGDRVVGLPELPHGGLAEFALLPASAVLAAPRSFSDEAAAAFTVAYQTAWFALHRRAELKSEEILLVHAGAGGVGSAAIQLGKAAGARVIAVAGGAAKATACRRLGADHVIDRTSEDVIKEVKSFSGGHGADVVFDPVGGTAFHQSTRCVAFEGRIVVIGFASGRIPEPALGHTLVRNYAILGLHWNLYRTMAPQLITQTHRRLLDLAAQGVVNPLVSEVVPMAEAARALAKLGAGATTGRIVVMP